MAGLDFPADLHASKRPLVTHEVDMKFQSKLNDDQVSQAAIPVQHKTLVLDGGVIEIGFAFGEKEISFNLIRIGVAPLFASIPHSSKVTMCLLVDSFASNRRNACVSWRTG